MAVALVGHQQLAWSYSPLVWPSGTAAGHVAVVWCDWSDDGPSQSDWREVRQATWWRTLDDAAVAAGPGAWAGKLRGLAVVSGCRGVGSVSSQRGVTISEAGGALLTEGWSGYWPDASGLGPSTDRLGNAIQARQDQWCAWWLRTGLAVGYQAVAKDSAAWGYRSFELLPMKGPDAPTLLEPSGQVDATQPVTFRWRHNSSSGLAQDGFKLRTKPSSSGTWQYLTSSGALNASEQPVSSSADNLTCPAGTFTSVQWDWSASTRDSGVWSPWA